MHIKTKTAFPRMLLAALAVAQPAVAGVVPQGTYSDWNLPNRPAEGFYNIDGTIYPSNDPVAGTGQSQPWLFYSSQFGIVNGDGGYIGIQKDPNGKRAIFSIWGANGASCASVAGAICRPFTGEGDGYQTMIPYNWVAGHYYRTRVWAVSTDANGDWWVGAIIDDTTATEQVIGYIRVPLSYQWLNGYTINWVEWYGPQSSTCAQLPSSTVYFAPPRANNGAVVASAPHNHLGGGACPSTIQMYGEWARHHNGSGS